MRKIIEACLVNEYSGDSIEKEIKDGIKELSKYYVYELRTGTNPRRVIDKFSYTNTYKYGSPDWSYENVKDGLKKELKSKKAKSVAKDIIKVLDDTLREMKNIFKEYDENKSENQKISKDSSVIYSKFEKRLQELGIDDSSISLLGKQLGLNYMKSSNWI